MHDGAADERRRRDDADHQELPKRAEDHCIGQWLAVDADGEKTADRVDVRILTMRLAVLDQLARDAIELVAVLANVLVVPSLQGPIGLRAADADTPRVLLGQPEEIG